MSELIIDLHQMALPQGTLAVLREEWEGGGLSDGSVSVGPAASKHNMIDFLWHISGKKSVSMTLSGDDLIDTPAMRRAAQDFLIKWNQRAS